MACKHQKVEIEEPFQRGDSMKKSLLIVFSAVLLFAGSSASVQADDPKNTLVITMTNDADANAIVVIDAATHTVLQTLSTKGKGGVAGNAGGVKQHRGKLFAAVNNGSGTVSLFRREGNRLNFEQLVVTTSAPVSVDFSNDHMYVAGSTSVDSFTVRGNHVGAMDGTTGLVLAGGGIPRDGSTAQVGALDDKTLLVTLKTDPTPGTVDVISLKDGAISGIPTAVSAPAGSLTPFGFSVYPDGTALITLAHSAENGLFRNGAFAAVVNSGGQGGPCWTTRVGKYVLVVNAGSRTISRLVSTGSNIFVDSAVAASIVSGAPTDTDAEGGYLGVIDHSGGASATSHLTIFTYNQFAELSASGSPIDLGVRNANGVAVMVPKELE
jgi:hypothetical protein